MVKIYRSNLKFPPSRNKNTLYLAKHLSNTDDLSIFETKLIQIYLKKRNKETKAFLKLEGLLIIVGCILLVLHASYFRDYYILIPLLMLQTWNFMIEWVELYRKGTNYFRDGWNYCDILRFTFSYLYFFLLAMNAASQTTKDYLLTFLCLFQGLKAFSIFSIFATTRVLLRIVIEIIKDMVPYMIFMIATTMLISLLFTASTSDDQVDGFTFPNKMLEVFLLDFGDFSTDKYTMLDLIIFVLSVLAGPLVMLNMVIALMGDTFDRVKE